MSFCCVDPAFARRQTSGSIFALAGKFEPGAGTRIPSGILPFAPQPLPDCAAPPPACCPVPLRPAVRRWTRHKRRPVSPPLFCRCAPWGDSPPEVYDKSPINDASGSESFRPRRSDRFLRHPHGLDCPCHRAARPATPGPAPRPDIFSPGPRIRTLCLSLWVGVCGMTGGRK